MSPSLPQILLVLIVVLLLFGAKRLPDTMGNLAKGIKSFKKGLKDEPPSSPQVLASQSDDPSESEKASVPKKEASAPAERKAS